jgi:hypothetical protein
MWASERHGAILLSSLAAGFSVVPCGRLWQNFASFCARVRRASREIPRQWMRLSFQRACTSGICNLPSSDESIEQRFFKVSRRLECVLRSLC